MLFSNTYNKIYIEQVQQEFIKFKAELEQTVAALLEVNSYDELTNKIIHIVEIKEKLTNIINVLQPVIKEKQRNANLNITDNITTQDLDYWQKFLPKISEIQLAYKNDLILNLLKKNGDTTQILNNILTDYAAQQLQIFNSALNKTTHVKNQSKKISLQDLFAQEVLPELLNKKHFNENKLKDVLQSFDAHLQRYLPIFSQHILYKTEILAISKQELTQTAVTQLKDLIKLKEDLQSIHNFFRKDTPAETQISLAIKILKNITKELAVTIEKDLNHEHQATANRERNSTLH